MQPLNKGGRPAFKPTADHRLKVQALRMDGRSKGFIAKALGIDEDTLSKHFADEIETGGAILRGQIVLAVVKKARKGDISAARLAELMVKQAAPRIAEEEFGAPDDSGAEDQTRAPKLGKKEQAKVDALTAGVGTEWGDDLQAALPANVTRLR